MAKQVKVKKKAFKKEWISVGINPNDEIDENDFYSQPLDQVIEKLTLLKEAYEERGFRNLRINLDAGYNNIMIGLSGERLENDKELEARKKRHQAAKKAANARKEKQKEKELRTLQRLLKKYPDEVEEV